MPSPLPPPPRPLPTPPAPVPGPAISLAPVVACAPVSGLGAVTTTGGTGSGMTGVGATTGVALERKLGGEGLPLAAVLWRGGGGGMRSGGGGGGGGATPNTAMLRSTTCGRWTVSPLSNSQNISACTPPAASAATRRERFSGAAIVQVTVP